jgi:hypothetical protein
MSQIVVLHIPHSSRHIPAEERQAICLDDAELDKELLRMTDAYTDELFPVTPVEAGRVVAWSAAKAPFGPTPHPRHVRRPNVIFPVCIFPRTIAYFVSWSARD